METLSYSLLDNMSNGTKVVFSQLLGVDLSDWHVELILRTLSAHYVASKANSNMSKMCYVNSHFGSGNALMGVIGGISTLGGAHGPITKARQVIFQSKTISELLESGQKVPGYGGSFFKDFTDPAFEAVCEFIHSNENFKILQDGAEEVNNHKGRTIVFPNAAGITACVAEILNLPDHMENWFFLAGRIPQWFTTKVS